MLWVKMTNFEALIDKRTMKKKTDCVKVPFCYYQHSLAVEVTRQIVRVNKTKKTVVNVTQFDADNYLFVGKESG